MNTSIFNSFPKLESSRLLFQDLAEADRQEILYMRSDPSIYQFLDRQPSQSLDDIDKFIDIVKTAFAEQNGISWVLVKKEDKRVVGYIGLWRIAKEHNRGEIGYALKKEFWGLGMMKEAIDLVVRFGFNQMELHSIMADVNPLNEKSLRVLEKCNFKREAYHRENYFYNGKYLDSVIFGLLERDIS
jgi:ribosomal-protein-alanine N-acetyltransferase